MINDPARSNQRDVYYYYLEGVQHLTRKLYTAGRWSQILAHKGFPLVGNANYDEYFNQNDALTTKLWRLSLGFGYRLSENVLLKTEYSFEQGNELGGEKRKHENLFAAELAFKF